MTLNLFLSIIVVVGFMWIFYSMVDEVCIKIKTWQHYSWVKSERKVRNSKYRRKMKLFREINKLDKE